MLTPLRPKVLTGAAVGGRLSTPSRSVGTGRWLNALGLRMNVKCPKAEHLGFEASTTCLEVALMALGVELLVQFSTTPIS